MTDIITVKIIRIPGGSVNEIGLEGGKTITEALAIADVTVGGQEAVTLNGSSAEGSVRLSDGDRIVVSKSAKGNT